MCTLTLWWRTFAGAEVVVAANRDEDPRRAFAPPAPWPDDPAGIFAGRDLTAGGTWLGTNRHGLVAGVTNLWSPWPPDRARRSRGLVVAEALRSPTARAAAETLADLRPIDFNPFVLMLADRDNAYRVDCHSAITVRPLAPGISVFANWAAEDRMPRTDRALALARDVPTGGDFNSARPALERLVADHDGAEIRGRAICVHGDTYATVCSTLLAVTAARTLWRDTLGNPCTAPWFDRDLT